MLVAMPCDVLVAVPNDGKEDAVTDACRLGPSLLISVKSVRTLACYACLIVMRDADGG
jgi:hypothetical protein